MLLAIPIVAWQAIQTPEVAWFFALWCAIVGWGAYRSAYRVAYRIDLKGDSVAFKTLAITSSVRVDQFLP